MLLPDPKRVIPRGVRERIKAYFEANPDEELSRADMALKFSVSVKTVDIALQQLRTMGMLEPVHAWRRPAKARL